MYIPSDNEEEGDDEKKIPRDKTDESTRLTTSISLELQRLFKDLQHSTGESVSTALLIDSFGWSAADAWVQHDVQEFCRILMDALVREGSARAYTFFRFVYFAMLIGPQI